MHEFLLMRAEYVKQAYQEQKCAFNRSTAQLSPQLCRFFRLQV